MTTTTLSALESHLWEDANILRGSPVDRTDWKSYILPLMFFKWICDVWDEEYEEAVKTYGEGLACESVSSQDNVCFRPLGLRRGLNLSVPRVWQTSA